jgi:hypothetical protein
MIITCYITGVPIAEEVRLEMIRYLSNCQREDGGWGLYVFLFIIRTIFTYFRNIFSII